MITHKDQLDMFKLVSKGIKKDVECYAFGGTAMMFYGCKDETKDVDLFFINADDRLTFIEAIKRLGFEETGLLNIYIPEKLRDPNRPLMFKRDDWRFDLFAKKIFHTVLSPGMKEDPYATHEFKEKNLFRMNVMRKEHIVQLKAVTERQNDFDDIRTIVEKDKNFDWQYLIDETIWQHKHGDRGALIDVGKMMEELKKYVFIEQKYFKKLHKV